MSVKDGQISAGDVLANCLKKLQNKRYNWRPPSRRTFEARRPKDSAIIAENDGVIEFGKEVRGKQKFQLFHQMVKPQLFNSKGKHVNLIREKKIKKVNTYLMGVQLLTIY